MQQVDERYITQLESRLKAIDAKLAEVHTVIFGPPGDPLPTGLRGMLAKVMDRVEQTERQRSLDRESENDREKSILRELKQLQTTRIETRGNWQAVKEIGTALAILFSGISGLVAAATFLFHQGGK